MNDTIFKREENTLMVERVFNAPIELVWRAWTEADILDQWWAPKPWKSETKYMKFVEGGYRLYAMLGPQGERHWGRTEYKTIFKPQTFTGQDYFCDEEGIIDTSAPVASFSNQFYDKGIQTKVVIITVYPTEADLQTVIDMGMQEGLKMVFQGLDQALQVMVK